MGSVISTLPYSDAIQHGSAARAFATLEHIAFGAFHPSATHYYATTIYEDDGMSEDYLQGVAARITIESELVTLSRASTQCRLFTFSEVGEYPGIPSSREHRLRLKAIAAPPVSVRSGGQSLPQNPDCTHPMSWCMTGRDLLVTLSPTSRTQVQDIEVCCNA